MIEDAAVFGDSDGVAQAADVENVEPEERRAEPEPEHEARCAMAFAVLGVLFLGVVFGPLALQRGRRARILLFDAPHGPDATTANHAIAIGKAGLALHLAILATLVPWLLFVLPLLRG